MSKRSEEMLEWYREDQELTHARRMKEMEAQRRVKKSEVEILVEACKDLLDMVLWTSGSADFGHGGIARKGWERMEPRIQAARDALALFEGKDL